MTLIYYIIVAVIGLCVGSFLNVVIYRVPNKMSIVKPNSHCPKCNTPIKWYDNIPVLSYILLKGKCRHCREHIAFRYVLVELLNSIMWVLCYYAFNSYGVLLCIISMLVCSILIVVAFIDFEHLYILDRFQIMLLVLGVVLCVFASDMYFTERLIGLAVGGGFMLLIYGLGYLMLKREPLGIGDIKLTACIGLILGYKNVILTLIIASVLGAIILLILNGKEKGKEYPFAPFLCLGAVVALIFGNAIINGYLSLFQF